MDNRIITALFREGECVAFTSPVYQYNYGQILKIEGIELPSIFEVQFANEGEEDSTTSIGQNNQVDIPDMFFESGKGIRAWIYLHDTAEDGETVYQIMMPVIERAEPSDIEPTPVQQDVITQAIAALDEAVSDCEEAVHHYPKIDSETGNWTVWDGEEEAWSDTGVHAQGEQGEPGTPGADGKDGKDGVDGKDGKDGVDGQNGQDGFSPVVSVSAITGGHEVSITDASGTETFDVMDGDPTTIIDDSSTSSSKVWSASKVNTQLATKLNVTNPKYTGNIQANQSWDIYNYGSANRNVGLGNGVVAIMGDDNLIVNQETNSYSIIQGNHNVSFSKYGIQGDNNFVTGHCSDQTSSIYVNNAIAIHSYVGADNTIGIGCGSKVFSEKAVSIGENASVGGNSSNSVAIGTDSKVTADAETSIAIGKSTNVKSIGSLCMMDGANTDKYAAFSIAVGKNAHACRRPNSQTTDDICDIALGYNASAEGLNCIAIGTSSLAKNSGGVAIGNGSQAIGNYSVALGQAAKADAEGAVALGATRARSPRQVTMGKFNIEDTNSTYAEIFGNGTSNNAQSNARTLDWSGNEWLAGKLTIAGTPTGNNDVVRMIDIAGKQDSLTAGDRISISNNVISALLPWKDVTGTLTAGSTSITLSDSSITTSSTIEVYTDVFGVNPSNVIVSTGSVTLTFDALASDMGVKVRVS